MSDNKVKELIEENLLDAMRAIDKAQFHINEKLSNCQKYSTEIGILSVCKSKIKNMLNQHFDKLARGENQSDNQE